MPEWERKINKTSEINLSSEFANIKTNQDKQTSGGATGRGWGFSGCMCADIFLEPCGAAINTVIQLIIARHKRGVCRRKGGILIFPLGSVFFFVLVCNQFIPFKCAIVHRSRIIFVYIYFNTSPLPFSALSLASCATICAPFSRLISWARWKLW